MREVRTSRAEDDDVPARPRFSGYVRPLTDPLNDDADNYVEAHSFFHLERLVLASVSLLLAALPGIGQGDTGALVDEALAALKHMSDRGNSSALKALDQLHYIRSCMERGNASWRTMPLLPDSSLASFDGRLLSKDMLDIMGLSHAPGLGSVTSNQILETVLDAAADGGDSLPSLAGGPYIDALGSGEDFSFDMADLQWLDAVQ